jgi:transcriptional antiterminator RfaH
MSFFNDSESKELSWYALHVRTKRELSVQQQLRDKGYETYIPCLQHKREWADRTKVTTKPLFPNYVFCRFDANFRLPIVTTPDVYSVLSVGKQPVPVPAEELEAVQRVITLCTNLSATPQPLGEGERVLLTSGALKGLEGVVVRANDGWHLVVLITLLQRGVMTKINREDVEVLTPNPAPTRASGSAPMGL